MYQTPIEGIEPDMQTIRLLSRTIGDMVKQARDGVIDITPILAQRILDNLNFAAQRSVKPQMVHAYRNDMLTGNWDERFPIHFAKLPDGRLVSVNMQHRLRAVVAAGIAVRMAVVLIPVADLGAMRALYAKFDPAGSERSEAQVLAGYGLSDQWGIKPTVLSRAFAALKLLLNDFQPTRNAGSEKAQYARLLSSRNLEFPEWVGEVLEWQDIARVANHSLRTKLLTAGVMAFGLYTLKHQPAKAKEFWMGLARNDGLARDDPRARLIDALLTRKSGPCDQHAAQVPCVAWNAWTAKRTLRQLKIIEDTHLRPWGTPLATRQL